MERVLMMDCGDGYRRADNGSLGPEVAKAASYTIGATETGTTFSNRGATGSITFTLPTAKVGMIFRFIKAAAQSIVIAAAAADKINGGTAGKKYQNVTAGDNGLGTCTLCAVRDSATVISWYVLGEKGTWSNDNT